jgi:transposase
LSARASAKRVRSSPISATLDAAEACRALVLVWDNVRTHLTADLREDFAANTDWLTVFQLPAHAPDPNPREGVWSLVNHDLGNLAAADLGQITRTVKRKVKMLQYRPRLLDSCLTGSGLALDA